MTDFVSGPILELRQALRQVAQEGDCDWLHAPKNLALALSVAATQLLGSFQWLTDAESAVLSPQVRERLADDMADILLYLILLGDRLEVDFSAIARTKMPDVLKSNPKASSSDSERA